MALTSITQAGKANKTKVKSNHFGDKRRFKCAQHTHTLSLTHTQTQTYMFGNKTLNVAQRLCVKISILDTNWPTADHHKVLYFISLSGIISVIHTHTHS